MELPQLDYESAQETDDFAQEVKALDTYRYSRGDRPRHLLVIYRRLIAGLSPFAQQLRFAADPASRFPILKPWLDSWITEANFRDKLFDVQLYLDARGVEEDVLRASFAHPDALLSPNHLGILRAAPKEALRQWASFQDVYPSLLNDEDINLGFHLLLDHFFHAHGERGTNEALCHFLKEVVPALKQKFSDQPNVIGTERFADWFKIWQQHQLHTVPNIPADHAYYDLGFTTILQYLPSVILWNNGLPYRNGQKAFNYYSPEFFWLATGGSLRKIPHHPPYSKRMAKEFLALPAELPTGDADIYTYCFLRSLECPPDMCLALQDFFLRPETENELAEWKTRLDPVVQKLREFDRHWQSEEATKLLGYLYHCVRDQADFTVTGLSIEVLLRRADDYYARIAERRQEAERRAAARAAALESEGKSDTWPGMNGVKSWEQDMGAYANIRKIKLVELTTKTHLLQESAMMRHCVSSYLDACRSGATSIWSLRELRQNGIWISLVTLEIKVRRREIIQIRGKFNATPSREHLKIIEVWAEREKMVVNQDRHYPW